MKKRGKLGLILVLIVGFVLILSLSLVFGKNSNVKADSQVINEIQNTGKAKVIVVLKDQKDLPDKFKAFSSQALREQAINNIKSERVKHRFTSFNGFSASLTAEELARLEADESVERIDYDAPVHAFLQDSTVLINATKTWPLQINGINITGEGETICIIDTGVNYTHSDLGGCTVNYNRSHNITGNVVDYVLQNNAHPYSVNLSENHTINYTGFSKIAVHFVRMSTEIDFDYVDILDSNNNTIISYTGGYADIWTPNIDGDTITVRLRTDDSNNDYGFYVDKILNGTYNNYTESYNWSNCSKVIGGWDYKNKDPDPYDDHGHGTHVAGIAAADGGIKGVAPSAKLISIKSLDSDGNGYSEDIIKGIEWCTNNASLFNISVISMSLGGYINYTSYCDGNNVAMATAINQAVGKNISVIAATGNNGWKDSISSPACIQNVTAVGDSYDKNVGPANWIGCTDTSTWADKIVCHSNRNNITDLFAPGAMINSTTTICSSGFSSCTGLYANAGGTSMATPHVAGAFALVRQFYLLKFGRVLRPYEIQDVLNDTGKIINDTGGSGLNFSRIDVYSAILSLSGGPNVTLNSPSASYVNETAFAKNITFNCSANDDLGLTNISLWITNSNNQSFSLNQTTSVSGTTNSTIFVLGLGVGSYTWNCQARNAGGQESFSSSNKSIVLNQAKQVILVGVDGMQYNHYVEMLQSGELSNFSKLVNGGGWNGTANITGHSETETAPGNAELHTGLNKTLNLVHNNSYWSAIPNGNTTFERLKTYNSRIVTGSVYGKNTSYIPDGILANAKAEVDWWHNRTTFSNSNWQDGGNCIYSENVSNKAREFIGNYSDQSFYLVVYFGVPDCTGHVHGENSSEYNQSFVNVDNALGILLDALEDNGLRGVRNITQIIVTADHGWNENSTGHDTANSDTIVLPLITNSPLLIMNATSDGREQCEIAPTILNYFGMASSQYQDIVNNGCDSMLGSSDSTSPSITINTPANNTWYNATKFNITINEEGFCWAVYNDNTNITLNNVSSARTSFFYENPNVSETTSKRYNVTFYCNDTSGNLNSTERRYFGVDKTLPIIRLVSPANNYRTNTTSSSKSITFVFNATDNSNEISICELIVGESVSDSLSDITAGVEESISQSLDSDEDYNWGINCTDEAGNKNSSETRHLYLDKISSGDGKSKSGDGDTSLGDEEYTGVTYTLTESVIKNGTDKKLREDDKVIFKISNRSHTLTMVDVKTASIRIKIESDIVRADLNISDEKKFDLNKDDYLDFYVKLNGISWLIANLTLKEIYEASNISINATLNENITGMASGEGDVVSRAFVWLKDKIGGWTWKMHLYVWVPTGLVIIGGVTTFILVRRYLKKKKYYEKGVGDIKEKVE